MLDGIGRNITEAGGVACHVEIMPEEPQPSSTAIYAEENEFSEGTGGHGVREG